MCNYWFHLAGVLNCLISFCLVLLPVYIVQDFNHLSAELNLVFLYFTGPEMAALYKAWLLGHSLAGIAGSN